VIPGADNAISLAFKDRSDNRRYLSRIVLPIAIDLHLDVLMAAKLKQKSGLNRSPNPEIVG
jgi:hypothetical protein